MSEITEDSVRRVCDHGAGGASYVITIPKSMARKMSITRGSYLRWTQHDNHFDVEKVKIS